MLLGHPHKFDCHCVRRVNSWSNKTMDHEASAWPIGANVLGVALRPNLETMSSKTSLPTGWLLLTRQMLAQTMQTSSKAQTSTFLAARNMPLKSGHQVEV